MKIAPVIRRLLSEDQAVSAIVGDRVFPAYLPAGRSGAAVVFRVTGGERPRSLRGSAGATVRTVELRCIARDYDTVEALEEAVFARVDSWRENAAQEDGAERVQLAASDPGTDEVDLPEDGSDEVFHIRVIQLRVHCTETKTSLHG